MFHFDMANLTLQVDGEEAPRLLHCKLLEPNQDDGDHPMTAEELKNLFTQPGAADQAEDAVSETSGEDMEDNEMNDALVEAENLMPVQPIHLGDGDLEVLEDMPSIPMPDFPQAPVVDVGKDYIIEDEEYKIIEEIEYQPQSKASSVVVEDGPPVLSSTASSSTGLNATPLEVRHSVPPGAKLQRKLASSSGRCDGWQAWPHTGLSSKWFSYGDSGRYATSETALEAALAWLWDSSS